MKLLIAHLSLIKLTLPEVLLRKDAANIAELTFKRFLPEESITNTA